MTVPKQGYGTCEYCGVSCKTDTQVSVGAVVWSVCAMCEPLVRDALAGAARPRYPFGAPAETLADPATSVAWWLGYRLACEDVGYTTLTATGRPERDALSEHTNRWLSAILGLRHAMGLAKDYPPQGFYVAAFRRHLREQFGAAPAGAMTRRGWLLSKLAARTARPAPPPVVQTHAAVPPRGALWREAAQSLDTRPLPSHIATTPDETRR